MTISNLTKMEESYPNGSKTLWGKEKLLVTGNFSFSHSVFKKPIAQGRQKVSLSVNGLSGSFIRIPTRITCSKNVFFIIIVA